MLGRVLDLVDFATQTSLDALESEGEFTRPGS